MTMPFYWLGEPLHPCNYTDYLLSFCDNVAKKCPYFLPQLDGQYAGEPSFLCTGGSGVTSTPGGGGVMRYHYTSSVYEVSLLPAAARWPVCR